MAFNPERLSLLVQPIGENGLRFYGYQTDDVEATLTAAGYATNAADYGLRAYDLIFISPLDASVEPYILAVETINADGHATLASPGPIGDLKSANNLSDVADAATALANLGGMAKATYDPTNIAASAFARANHTGTQTASTISDFSTAADARVSAAIGTNVQAYDADLGTIAGLAKTDGNVIVGDGTNWVAESGATARASLGAASTGANTFAGGQTISASYGTVILNKSASGNFNALIGQTAGVNRWVLYPGNSDAESTADAGSNFSIDAVNDAGTPLFTPLSISRATGVVTMLLGAVIGDASGDPVTIKGTLVDSFSSALMDNANAAAWRTDIAAAAIGANTFTGAQTVATVALTDAATVALDLSLSNDFTLAIAGNRTLGNPTNRTVGQWFSITITQDATGSRTLAYDTYYKFPGGTAPALSTTANAVDTLTFRVRSSTAIDLIGIAKAFS